jgi:hypothetical protein
MLHQVGGLMDESFSGILQDQALVSGHHHLKNVSQNCPYLNLGSWHCCAGLHSPGIELARQLLLSPVLHRNRQVAFRVLMRA